MSSVSMLSPQVQLPSRQSTLSLSTLKAHQPSPSPSPKYPDATGLHTPIPGRNSGLGHASGATKSQSASRKSPSSYALGRRAVQWSPKAMSTRPKKCANGSSFLPVEQSPEIEEIESPEKVKRSQEDQGEEDMAEVEGMIQVVQTVHQSVTSGRHNFLNKVKALLS
ncbi:hypothetical protein RhiLY_05462 [Ceratobasidium sp. AG-Ba]|nr:hypothetical protein RhiLY_05462 [Ceratobasidium sp. AG-Ba]